MYIRLFIILTNLVLFNYTIVNGIEQADSLLIENNINTNKTNLVSLNILGPTCFTSISFYIWELVLPRFRIQNLYHPNLILKLDWV